MKKFFMIPLAVFVFWAVTLQAFAANDEYFADNEGTSGVKTVLIFGDSNSWGWNPGNDLVQPIERWSDDIRWPGVMQRELGNGFKVLVDGLVGRTTVWTVPNADRRGEDQIVPSMDEAAPIDLLIIFLGTNDLNVRHSASAQDVANGAASLVQKALAQTGAFTDGSPKIILVAPPPLGPVSNGIFRDMFAGSAEKSSQLGSLYRIVADTLGVEYLDAGAIVRSSDIDGVHLDADQHELLGKAMADAVKKAIGRI